MKFFFIGIIGGVLIGLGVTEMYFMDRMQVDEVTNKQVLIGANPYELIYPQKIALYWCTMFNIQIIEIKNK